MDLNYLVSEHGTNDPFKIIYNMGINISLRPYKKTLGYYLNGEGIQHIVINSNLDNEMQRIVAAHELGHAILHKDISIACSPADTANWVDKELINKLEKEADLFGLCLLEFNTQSSTSDKTSSFFFFFFPDDSDEEYIAQKKECHY